MQYCAWLAEMDREREREGGKAIDSLELGLFIFEECKPEPCMFNLFSTSG